VVLGAVYRVISAHLLETAGVTRSKGHTGAVTLIQRFGSALNLNIHFHMIFLDGSSRRSSRNWSARPRINSSLSCHSGRGRHRRSPVCFECERWGSCRLKRRGASACARLPLSRRGIGWIQREGGDLQPERGYRPRCLAGGA
jgi:hypothetical protein